VVLFLWFFVSLFFGFWILFWSRFLRVLFFFVLVFLVFEGSWIKGGLVSFVLVYLETSKIIFVAHGGGQVAHGGGLLAHGGGLLAHGRGLLAHGRG